MNWEVEVYRVSSVAKVSVQGCETKHDAEQAALRLAAAQPERLQPRAGWVACATTWPYDQTVRVERTKQARPPELWTPPQWRKGLDL